jgi:hypothetical protein
LNATGSVPLVLRAISFGAATLEYIKTKDYAIIVF